MTPKYFIVSHNDYAKGLKNALEMIAGPQENVQALGLFPGGHPDMITAEIEAQIDDETPVVILGDMAGGSVCNSVLRLTTKTNVCLITGVNLPLVLEIILTKTADPAMIAMIIANVREGMKTVELSLATSDEADDLFN